MNTSAIDSLAESVWRRVIGYEQPEAHFGCATNDPDDCGLFREIHDEITMWASKQAKEEA